MSDYTKKEINSKIKDEISRTQDKIKDVSEFGDLEVIFFPISSAYKLIFPYSI